MSEKLTTHTPEAQVPKEAPQAPKEAVKPTETPEAVLAKAVWPRELAEIGLTREKLLVIAKSQPGFAEEIADNLADDPDFFRKNPDELGDIYKIWKGKAGGSDVRESKAESRDASATAEKLDDKAEFSKELERLRALNRDILDALPADRKAVAEKAVAADAAKVSESIASGKPTGDVRLDEIAKSAKEKGLKDPAAVADMAASSYLLSNRSELLSSVPESARASLGAKFAELEGAARSSGVAFGGSVDRALEASKTRDRELVKFGNTSVSTDAVRVGDRVRIADQTFDLASEPPRKFIEGKGLRIETTAPYQAKFETASRLSELRAEKASIKDSVGKSVAVSEGLSSSILRRQVELERSDPERYRAQAESLREELRGIVEGHFREGELWHPLDQAAAQRLLASVSPETVDKNAKSMERSVEISKELSRLEESEAAREENFRNESERRDAAARANRDRLASLGAGGLGQGNLDRLVTTPDGKTETVEDAVRHAVSRLSGGTGDVPKARIEEAVKGKN